MMSGRLVAPIKTTPESGCIPSISVRSCDTMRYPTAPWVFSR